MAKKDEFKEAVAKHPNVTFVGMHPDGAKKEVPEYVMFPRLKVDIPKVKHGEGFFSEHAAHLIQLNDFKPFIAKGAK
jgi:hypothetical protein